ncbi:MAG TPA: tRNA (adenosine(37)-N6)-threonylcarbamoyltransferase complex dimerization subunit type 1 TsaB [Polyangiaceae bacterium]
MRLLGIETSTRRGSVALIEGEALVAAAEHAEPNAHAEKLLPLIEQLMAEAGWARSSLERVAVGVGPGSFTGLRVGVALAQGIGLGLDIPVVGVGSLRSMARALPATDQRIRYPMLDARRNELFLAAYSPDGAELEAPRAVPRAELEAHLASLAGRGPYVVLGEVCAEFALSHRISSPDTDLPHALWAARIGAALPPDTSNEPLYVRDAGAVRPELPPSPFQT